jgi:hypothetical protein
MAVGLTWRNMATASRCTQPLHVRTTSSPFGEEWTRRDALQTSLAGDAGLPPITLHDLRHTSASLALAAGVPMKVASELPGAELPRDHRRRVAIVLPEVEQNAAEACSTSSRGPPLTVVAPDDGPDVAAFPFCSQRDPVGLLARLRTIAREATMQVRSCGPPCRAVPTLGHRQSPGHHPLTLSGYSDDRRRRLPLSAGGLPPRTRLRSVARRCRSAS